jgi:hypothetical protein
MEEVKSPKTEAFLSSSINIEVKVDDRSYKILIPNGVGYEEAEWVCQEMSRLVMQMKEKSESEKKSKEALEPEIVSK